MSFQRENLHPKRVNRLPIALVAVVGSLFFAVFFNPVYGQQVGVSKAVSSATPMTGEQIVYSIDFGCSSLTTDCIGAKITDTLPAIFNFVGADPIIIETGTGPVAFTPTYDASAHALTYDFTTLPEMGLPDGFSGTAFFTMEIPAGITPNNLDIENKVVIISDNAGTDTDSITTTPQATPQWALTKSADQMIYHDRQITYTIQLCSEAEMGNLNLDNIIIQDTLPPGADFISATDGGIWDGNDPGIITWTFPNRQVTDPCLSMDVVVNYPSDDLVHNNTGLATIIPKQNKAVLTADPVGEPPLTLNDEIEDALLPPDFNLGIQKEANDNGILSLGWINYFDIGVSNPSTTTVDSFRVFDDLPPQFDLAYVRLAGFNNGGTIMINVEVNDSGVLIPWDTTTTADQLLDTAKLPYDPMVDYISALEFQFGSVASNFGGTIRIVVTPAFDGVVGSAVDNAGNPVELYTPYENCAEISGIRPLDGAVILVMPACDDMCFQDTVARLDPAKSMLSTNEMPPAGALTTGNPYLPGSKVTFTLHLENDGSDGVEIDNNGPISNDTLHNPIGSDLLPIGLDYIPDSWQLANNTTSLTLDNSGINPIFELINDFNGTGQTLLRWQFTGDFLINELVDLTFDANISAVSGTDLVNTFCMTAGQSFYCDEEDCGLTDTTNINNYFGTTSDPAALMADVSAMCCESTTFTVADSTAVLDGEKTVLSTGPYGPTGTDIVALGLATDTVEFMVRLANAQNANAVFPNPIAMDLLPEELDYIAGSLTLIDNTTGLAIAADGSNPTFEVLPNFASTGRTLLRWTYTGDFPINSGVSFSIKTLIREGSGGMVSNDFVYKTDDRFYNCLNDLDAVDNFDLDENGDAAELFCRATSPPFIIQTLSSLSAKKSVKGANDTTYLGLPDIGSTNVSDSVLWEMIVKNPGNVPLTEIVIVDVFPYIGDVGVQLNTTNRETGWRPFLVDTIAHPSDFDLTIYYSQEKNPCRPEIEPNTSAGCVDDWSTTYPSDLSTVQAIKIEVNDTLDPGAQFPLMIKMLAPDSMAIVSPIAWNSIARNAKELPAQEPNKVGVRLNYHDLALTKTLKSGYTNPFEVNDTVIFEINVFNQGNQKVHDIEVRDYIPTGLTLADNNWTLLDDSTATYLYTDTLSAGANTTIEVKMVIDRDVAGTSLTNYAEIAKATDEFFNPVSDIDSPLDTIRNNDPNGIDNNTTGDTPTDEDDHDGELLTIEACVITGLNFSTECLDNGTPNDPTDDRFILHLQPTGTSLSGTYSVTMGFMAMDSISYDSVYSSEGDSTFMAVMGGLNITIQDDSDPACTFTDTIPPPAPCSVVDLALDKSVDTTCAIGNELVTFSLLLRKEMWDITVEDVQVSDTLPDGLTYVSHVASQGNYNQNTGIWNVGTISEGTDSLVLTITARINEFHDGGIITNKAQVSATNLNDIDSTPNNDVAAEDDLDFACVSIPFYVCPDLQDSVLLTSPIGSTNVQWFRDTGTTAPFLVGTDTAYYAKAKGTYTFTADANLCDGGKCCPYYVREGCFDLALRKTVATTQTNPVAPGEDVTFTVKVFNQGDFPAYEVDIIDYLPNYLTLNDSDWTIVNDSVATYTFAGTIPVGDSVAVDITTTVDLNYQDSLLINFGEVQDATDRPGGATKPDRDSAPNDTATDDSGGVFETMTDNNIDATPPIDEDDHDPAGIMVHQIFDLALKKTLAVGQKDTVTWLDTVDFEITIYNQGTLHAYDIKVADYVPDSMVFIANTDWTLTDDTAFYIIDTLLARDSIKIPISLSVNGLFRGDSLINQAEISFASQASGSGIPSLDEDSTPDSDATNDGGGAVDSPADDYVNGVGGGTPNDGVAATDEDDFDPVLVHVVPCSLEVAIAEAICLGDAFDFNGTALNSAGIYIDTLTAIQFDCDSIITLTLTVNDTFQTILHQEICSGDSFNFNNQDLTTSGTYRDTLSNINGCDSFLVLNLIRRDTFRTIQFDTICSLTPYPFNGNNLTTSGIYYDTLATIHGCDSIIQLHLVVRDCDWGDLPDTSPTPATSDYQTTAANNGPVHIITAGLSLGATVDREADGQASPLADGDGEDEDGLMIIPSLNVVPGKTIRLPLQTTNSTGSTAHLEIWIDWNGDGELDDATEKIFDLDDSSGFPTYLTIAVPNNAATGQIGLRARISLQDNMTPYGLIESGEVEDYLLGVACPQVCLPIQSELRRGEK